MNSTKNIFEGLALLEYWKEGRWMFNKEVDTAIAELEPELRKIPFNISEDVINLPQMQKLREIASAILKMMGLPDTIHYGKREMYPYVR